MTAYKNNPFLLSLNQPPRSAKNGKHRRTSPPTHGNPVDGAGNGTRPADTFTITPRALDFSFAFEPAPIPYAGIRTGEIIGYRTWHVINGLDLRSLAHHFIWQPGETVSGDINKPIDDWYKYSLLNPIMGGVYAFRDYNALLIKVHNIAADTGHLWPINRPRGGASHNWHEKFEVFWDTYHGIALGTVKLWGEVVEHERGYRAQFAKIVSIDKVYGPVDLGQLCAKYLGEVSARD